MNEVVWVVHYSDSAGNATVRMFSSEEKADKLGDETLFRGLLVDRKTNSR